MEPTLRSLLRAAAGHPVRILVVLDGHDDETAACCRELGVETVLKTPAGPSKGAVLSWLVRCKSDLLTAVEAVLLVDVGSQVAADFFAALALPPGVDGLQTRLTGTGEGTGLAVAHSERVGQEWEDRGRQALGWAVRLRGTGTVFSPRAFLWVAPRLRTRIEDLEATLLLASAGYRLELAEAEVWDEKPSRVADAARQRARWLAGRVHLLFRHPLALGRLFLRRPEEALAFVVELVSRPLSLTAILRLLVASTFVAFAFFGVGQPRWELTIAAVLGASVLGDLSLVRLAGRLDWGSVTKLVSAWLGAVLLAPRALWHWMRVKR